MTSMRSDQPGLPREQAPSGATGDGDRRRRRVFRAPAAPGALPDRHRDRQHRDRGAAVDRAAAIAPHLPDALRLLAVHRPVDPAARCRAAADVLAAQPPGAMAGGAAPRAGHRLRLRRRQLRRLAGARRPAADPRARSRATTCSCSSRWSPCSPRSAAAASSGCANGSPPCSSRHPANGHGPQDERARAEAASRQATEAQLNLVRTQLEPHMLFNTLANLRSLMTIDPPRAQLMVDRLISFLRATLAASRHDEVTPRRRVRRAARLSRADRDPNGPAAVLLVATCRRSSPSIRVLPLLLQPLVENAVRHGLEPSIDGGRIDVRALIEGDRLVLLVEDTGVGFAPPQAAPATRRRLRAGAGPRAAGHRLRRRGRRWWWNRRWQDRRRRRRGTRVRLTPAAARRWTAACTVEQRAMP